MKLDPDELELANWTPWFFLDELRNVGNEKSKGVGKRGKEGEVLLCISKTAKMPKIVFFIPILPFLYKPAIREKPMLCL